MTFRVPLAVALLAFLLPPAVSAQEHGHPAGEALGKVTFPVSCNAEAGKEFERGVAMLHSFWFEQAVASFQRTASLDPKCGMAQWGVAMTLWGNPMARVVPAQDRSRSALDAAQKAVELTRTATPREQAYAEAALALYRDFEGKTFAQRMQAHEQAMASVHQRAPDDPEAAMFHARAMIAAAPPTDLTFARQIRAAEMLEPLFVKQPDHPGLAHYIIHAFDAAATARQGLDAAKRYAGIAPSAPHALHMPSHIFTRLGYWQESIETNSKSARAEPDSNAAVHPNDYMVYAYLQLGQDEAARKVIERSVNDPDRFYTSIVGYNYAAMAARYALERNRWEDAAKLTRLPGSPPLHVEAIPRFTRAIGAARSNNLALAREEVAALDQLRQKLEQANDSYWATLTEAQRLAAAAWLAHAEKNDAEAVRLARSAAEREESVEKHPVTPGPLLPARELEGDLLLELKRYPDALASYEKVLQREPRRARALFGAGRAAELANNRTAARKYYTELLDLLKNADAGRPELSVAKTYLGKTGI